MILEEIKPFFGQNLSKACFNILSADIFPHVFVIESVLFVRVRRGNDRGRDLATGLFSIPGPVRSKIVLSSSDELL